MTLLPTPAGHTEYVVTGSGTPVTVFAHGLAASIEETRPFGSGVPGTRAFLAFRGHGASSAPETGWTYAALAEELAAVADKVGATRALGVSMGAGALIALMSVQPSRLARAVLVMPAVLDRPRSDAAVARMAAVAELVDDRDLAGLEALLLEEQPPQVRDRDDVQVWVRRRARRLLGTPVSLALRLLPGEIAVADVAALAAVRTEVLVLTGEGDDAHPVDVARRTAEVLPRARLEVLPPGGLLWSHRARVRELVATFLAGEGS